MSRIARDCRAQTIRTGLEEGRLIQLRKDKMKLNDEVTHFCNEWALDTKKLDGRDRRRSRVRCSARS